MEMRFAIVLLPCALAACGIPEGEAPSLAARPIEAIADAPMRAIAPVPAASDGALASRISDLVSRAEQGQSAFAATLPRTRSAVSAAGGAGSESWIEAQTALSALDSARSPTTSALGELDAIFAGQAVAGEPAETDRLLDARMRVTALDAEQAEQYQALLSALRSR